MKGFRSLIVTVAGVLVSAGAASAVSLSVTGRVQMDDSQVPIADAQVTVIFHGHEDGIHEYTTERWLQVYTDADGYFAGRVKLRDRRYTWTHATLEVAATNRSKQAATVSACEGSDQQGWQCQEDIGVRPLAGPLSQGIAVGQALLGRRDRDASGLVP